MLVLVLVDPAALAGAGAIQDPAPTVPVDQTITDPDFIATFAQSICDQRHHGQLHDQETGTDQATLDPTDRTLAAGLWATLGELRAYARSPYGRRVLGRVRPIDTRGLVAALVSAESVVDPGARLDALTRVATAHGLAPLPGY